jgi:hypothetical protein
VRSAAGSVCPVIIGLRPNDPVAAERVVAAALNTCESAVHVVARNRKGPPMSGSDQSLRNQIPPPLPPRKQPVEL